MPEYIKDTECSRDTPVIWGKLSDRSYGTGKRIKPNIDGKHATDYEKKIYLPELLPLEEYDLVIVLFSGGKDSTAAYFKLLELGVPKNKIELWHHDIDGKNKERRMDWPCTQEYVKAFAEREKVTLRVSWRDQGFWGEVYRVGASYPIRYMQDGEVKTCSQSKQQLRSQELREQLADDFTEEEFEELKSYGYRMKFPRKGWRLNAPLVQRLLKNRRSGRDDQEPRDNQQGQKDPDCIWRTPRRKLRTLEVQRNGDPPLKRHSKGS